MLSVAAVNLSCGYYNAHTTSEYVVMHDVDTIYNEVCKLFDRTDLSVQFEYVEREYPKSWERYDRLDYGAYGDYTNYYDEDDEHYYTIEYKKDGHIEYDCIIADNIEVCLGKFMVDHPSVCYNDITDIIKEC